MRGLFLVVCIAGIATMSCSSAEREYFGYVSNGDKPAVDLRLFVRDNVVSHGVLSVLSPDFPVVNDGVDYVMMDLAHRNNSVHFRIRLLNGVSPIERVYVGRLVNLDDATIDLLLSEASGEGDEGANMFKLRRVQ